MTKKLYIPNECFNILSSRRGHGIFRFSTDSISRLLPKTRTPWTEFVFSTGTQACVVAFWSGFACCIRRFCRLRSIPIFRPKLVSAPVPVNHQPQPRVHLKPIFVAQLDPPTDALRLPAPQPKAAKLEEASAPAVRVTPRKLDPLPINPAPVVPKDRSQDQCFFHGQLSNAHRRAPCFASPNRRLRDPERNSRQRHSGESRQYRRVGILRSAIRWRIRQRKRRD